MQKILNTNRNQCLTAFACEERQEAKTTVTGIDHFNLRIPLDEIEGLRRFYCDVLGFRTGPRPAFSVPGYWLYVNRHPVLHLVGCPTEEASSAAESFSGRLDHIAFSCKHQSVVVARLKTLGIEHEVKEIPGQGECQVFLKDPAGICIELNFL